MRAIVFSVLVAAMLIVGTPSVHAALTEGQITSILSLLESFGAEDGVVRDVEVALRGGSTNCAFTEPLYRGVTDNTTFGQVTRVQNFLYVDPATGYYGPITERAVQVFQVAQGIVSGGTPETTGFGVVGPKTRAKLTEVCEARSAQENADTSSSTGEGTVGQSSTTGSVGTGSGTGVGTPGTADVPTTGSTGTVTEPPVTISISDEDYLDTLRSEVYDAGTAQGVSVQDLVEIDTALSQLPPPPTSETAATPAIGPELSEALSGTLASLLQNLFSNPTSAAASAVLRDFGTPRVASVVPCPCSGNVLITMQPTGPNYPVALTYTPGTQAFQNYNIPTVGQSLVGKYTPVGVCMVPSGPACVPVPNNGNITSLVGSSL